MSSMKLLDLFCGCGGASEGYRQAGFEIAAAVDNDPVAIASHHANHLRCEPWTFDLETDVEDLLSICTPGEFDVIHGSPPFPDFSQANNNPDPKRGLVMIHAFEQVVTELKPTWFIMENVRPVLHHLDGFYPRKRVLNAADFGVPQIRHRAFCGNFPDPVPTHSRRPQMTLDGRRLKEWVSVRQALGLNCVLDTGRDWRPDGSHQVRDGDEPSPALSTKVNQFHLVSKHCVGGVKGTRATRSVDDPAFTVATNMSGVKLWTGGGSIYGNTRAKLRSLDDPSFVVTQVPGRVVQPVDVIGKPAPCITATEDRFSPGSDDKNTRRRASGVIGRQLTPEECLILQGFDSRYRIIANKTNAYKQIGNAVPPPVTRAIGLAILGVE